MPAWLWKRKKGKGSLLCMLVPGDVFGFVFSTLLIAVQLQTLRALNEERYVMALVLYFIKKKKKEHVLFLNVVYNALFDLMCNV